MLYESEFLRALDEAHEKTTYARVIALDMDENPIEQVEGKITQGSVNIDGNSAVRRTCSLTMISQDININEYYWGLNTKFKLEIGVQNVVSRKDFYPNYPDIIWFKMGTYIITSLNTNLTVNNFTMSLQGKDKMCLLNGDVGGVINARTDFGTYDYYDVETGLTSNYKLPIKDILWDAVHAYANEPFHNIILNDLDELGLELLEYRYDVPLYLIRMADSDEYAMISVDGDMAIFGASDGKNKLSDITVYDNLTSSMLNDERAATTFRLNGSSQLYCAAKITYGDTAGYRTCDLVYAGDLIANIGDSVTSVFDKIKSMLGEFEYFYDLDGRFVFQRKKSLINTVWTPTHKEEGSIITADSYYNKENNEIQSVNNSIYGQESMYVEALALASNSIYNFNGTVLISSFQNSPNLANLRNDFTVWGNRKGISGSDIPIHMRYAIDNKPWRYIMYDEGENGHVALTTLTAEQIAEVEELKTSHSVEVDIWNAWASFEKNARQDPLMYAGGLLELDENWWEITDWAEYYAILFGEYPGTRVPDDWMREYCIERKSSIDLSIAYRKYYGDNSNVHVGSASTLTDTCVVFFYEKNGQITLEFNPHGRCSHTYAQFLDLEFYVNSGFQTETDIDLGNNRTYHYQFQGIYYSKNQLDNLRATRGLFHVLCYCYNPIIPEERMNAKLAELSLVDTYSDPYAGKYKTGLDWRELIYRMAKDYRKHNHEDGFERNLALYNYPLYPSGLTGYEQYYTDLEGFWRQLYQYPIDDSEIEDQTEYQYTYYRDIDNKKDDEHIYIKGCYCPLGKLVKNTVKEKLISNVPIYDYKNNLVTINTRSYSNISNINAGILSNYNTLYIYTAKKDRYYLLDKTKTYYNSTRQGFDFSVTGTLGKNYSADNFINLCIKSQLYTRDIPDITTIYLYKDGEMYKYLDTIDYVTPGNVYQKLVDPDSLGGYSYKLVNSETSTFSTDAKASLYILTNQSQYTSLQTQLDNINEEIDLLQAEYNTQKPKNSGTYDTIQSKKRQRTALEQQIASLQNGNLSYVKVSDYYQSKLTLSNDLYVWDETNLYKMSNIRIKLSSIYGTLKTEVPDKISSVVLNNYGKKTVTVKSSSCMYYKAYSDFYQPDSEIESERANAYWHKNVFEAPQSLNFWFDFLEGDNQLRQFTTKAVGDRPKAVNETTVKSIYYRDTPKIIFTTAEKLASEEKKTGYNYFILPDNSSYENMFTISAQGIDAKNRVDELLYQHSYCTESVTISAIPIYYLDVNKRIHVYDPDTGINGDYIVSRISYPLSYNGMMNVTATKAPENSVTEREE